MKFPLWTGDTFPRLGAEKEAVQKWGLHPMPPDWPFSLSPDVSVIPVIHPFRSVINYAVHPAKNRFRGPGLEFLYLSRNWYFLLFLY